MFGVRVFVAQNICLLSIYLFMHSYALQFFGGEFGIFGGKTSPPDVPRIKPGMTQTRRPT